MKILPLRRLASVFIDKIISPPSIRIIGIRMEISVDEWINVVMCITAFSLLIDLAQLSHYLLHLLTHAQLPRQPLHLPIIHRNRCLDISDIL